MLPSSSQLEEEDKKSCSPAFSSIDFIIGLVYAYIFIHSTYIIRYSSPT